VALLDENKRVAEQGYCLHHGDMRGAFRGLLENIMRRTGDAPLCRAAGDKRQSYSDAFHT
jgi:hypothetical protein